MNMVDMVMDLNQDIDYLNKIYEIYVFLLIVTHFTNQLDTIDKKGTKYIVPFLLL